MNKKKTFIDSPEWLHIVDNIKGIMASDSVIETLIDFERVLDESNIYAFKNWSIGELVDGPVIKRYDVVCTFMWPKSLMPDPRGAKRLLPLGCEVGYKKSKMMAPIKIESPNDYEPGTHYPKLVEREIWLVRISIPKNLMNDIREGSVDVADQSVDLQELDDAYKKDYDTADINSNQDEQGQQQMQQPIGGPGPGPGLGI